MTHGGYREGAGRKTVLPDSSNYAFRLTPEHVALLDDWQAKHGLETRSAALRDLIERTAKPRRVR